MTDIYEVVLNKKQLDFEVELPGSKSVTNRALLMAALSSEDAELTGVLFSDDSRHFIQCLIDLGYNVTVDESSKKVRIKSEKGIVPNDVQTINVGSAGTAARFLPAMLAIKKGGEYIINCSDQMKKRPMKILLDVLEQQGAKITYLGENGHLPVKINTFGLKGGTIKIKGDISSQFISALLMVASYCEDDVTIEIEEELTSKPYIDITLNMMKGFGVEVINNNYKTFTIKKGQVYNLNKYTIEPDISSACYFFAMPLLAGGSGIVKNVRKDCLQGDIKFLEIIERLGAKVTYIPDGVKVEADKNMEFAGIDVDMNDICDQVMTLSAIAPFATSNTIIRNIENLKYKETNRLEATITELNKMGIKADYYEDGIIIYNGIPTKSEVETYDDHRMAMAFSLVGLRTEGIKILNPSCTKKTFEKYFEVFDTIIK